MQETTAPPCFAKKDLEQLLTQPQGSVVVIDVRSVEEFSAQHIPGAIHIPLGELRDHAIHLNAAAQVITVCGKGGGRSAEGAAILQQAGIARAAWLCGGTSGWFSL